MGEGMEHPEEGYNHPRYPPRDYGGPADRGPRDYEGHNPERGRGRGFVSPAPLSAALRPSFLLCLHYLFPLSEILTSPLLASPNGVTVAAASLLCSFHPNAKERNLDDDDDADIDDDTLKHIPYTA